jgi:hypothetical protein
LARSLQKVEPENSSGHLADHRPIRRPCMRHTRDTLESHFRLRIFSYGFYSTITRTKRKRNESVSITKERAMLRCHSSLTNNRQSQTAKDKDVFSSTTFYLLHGSRSDCPLLSRSGSTYNCIGLGYKNVKSVSVAWSRPGQAESTFTKENEEPEEERPLLHTLNLHL